MSDQIVMIVISIAVSGIVQTFITAHVLKADMLWVKRELRRIDDAMIRAHQRIDNIEKRY